MKNIYLLDPSLKNNQGEFSDNLGDLIIYQSINKVLKSLYPNQTIVRVSTHTEPSDRIKRLLSQSSETFIGGTNLLSSNIRTYNQWKLSSKPFYYLFPYVRNAVLIGVGWWQYQEDPDFITRNFYRKVLHPTRLHSVRDGYTAKMLGKVMGDNLINTSCPTLWALDGYQGDRKNTKNSNCIFTITDYKKNKEIDQLFLSLLLQKFTGKLFFFPQGSGDIAYLKGIPCYQTNSSRFCFLKRSLVSLDDIISENDVCYIGTRLHGGIYCKNLGVESLVLAVDNRAAEIGKDTNLPVISRNDINGISSWIDGNSCFGDIHIPMKNITRWKGQFSPRAALSYNI
jgi:hypothetical protein